MTYLIKLPFDNYIVPNGTQIHMGTMFLPISSPSGTVPEIIV